MKKYSKKQRQRDVRRTHLQRKLGYKFYTRSSRRKRALNEYMEKTINQKIDRLVESGLKASITEKGRVFLTLPEKMNLSTHYDETMPYISAIRALSQNPRSRRYYRLAYVKFDALREISSSAALLLTSELSRWDDSIRNRLTPQVNNWDPIIFEKFNSLGFFNLFRKAQVGPPKEKKEPNVQFMKYLKGNHEDKDYRRLKVQLHEVIGERVQKWVFLHGGLDEAITNVCHHAYPKNTRTLKKDQNWYLTGAFDKVTRELKIVFCDQGVGIPKSLPSSKIWEKVLEWTSSLPNVNRSKHATLLKAAMEVSRTSTNQSDRGKGLPDMKEFIRKRGAGYLAIMSGHGMYKLMVSNGQETHKSDTLRLPVEGTLIIWRVQL
ncbi:hypothetical protein RSO68_08090 [Halomonas saccharevitans]|uniref:Histidine kinase-, DNA gyrase B-, and HSP90-like ATPase n=1 Tax=Halomonas saccharevitans TaxID=416872 RepID=A0ABU3NE09_9GAMM|nr:hypothetical protein [Halomonas saccharevitans]MDT8879426.1 hypothetical protein [Halomonas saccharevitans]